MKVYSFLKKSAPFFGIKLFLFGILAGIISTLLIVIINNVIDKDPTNKIFYKEIAIAYAVAMALFFIIQYIYQTMLIKMSQKLIWSLRVKVLDNIRNCDFGKFQRIGYEHVYTVLTTDVENISFLSNVLASIVTSAVTILFCLVYMAWLTPSGFWITIVMIIIVMAVYLLRQKKIMQQLNDSRDKENEFFKYIHHLVYGIKEVKMSRPASDDLFLNYLSHTAKDAESLKTNSNIAFMNNSLLGQLYFFVILGVFLFLLPAFHIHLLNNTPQYILITLYIMAPAQTIAQLMPYFSYANIGIERFERLQQELSTAMDTATGTISDPVDFKMLEFKNICYAYESVEEIRQPTSI